MTGHGYSIHQQHWPQFDTSLAAAEEFELVVQVNGKVRDQVMLPADVAHDEAQVRAAVLELPRIQQHTAGQTVQRVIVVPGKLANVVVREPVGWSARGRVAGRATDSRLITGRPLRSSLTSCV